MSWLIGNLVYGSYTKNGQRYAVRKNENVIERIIIIGADCGLTVNTTLWEENDEMTPLVLEIMENADYTKGFFGRKPWNQK